MLLPSLNGQGNLQTGARFVVMAQNRFFLLLCSLLCFTAANCSAQGIQGLSLPEETSGAEQSLIRLRDRERMLRRIAGQPLNNAAFSVLEQVFAHPIDVAMGESEESVWTGQREFSVQLLRQASPEVQRSWQILNEAAGSAALQQALRLRSAQQLSDVAARYPLTREGLRAEFIVLNWRLLQADFTAVSAGIERIRKRHAGTILADEAGQLITRLQQKFDLFQPFPATSPSRTASNWVAEPDWSWSETSWLGSLEHRVVASGLLSEWGNLYGVRSHPLERWGDWLVTRTPFRVAGLDPETGAERWSLIEESSAGDRGNDQSVSERGGEFPAGLGKYITHTQLMMLDFSRRQIVCDGGDLWVLGGLDLFDRGLETAAADDPFRNFRHLLPDQSLPQADLRRARSLVALRYRDGDQAPQIAWVAGDAHGYTGGVRAGPITKRMTADDFDMLEGNHAVVLQEDSSLRVAAPLAGHEFLCPPAINEQRLFILSESDGVCFLNCLNRGTGRVYWQQPVSIGGQTQQSDFRPWMSVYDQHAMFPVRCYVAGGSVICQLSSCIWMSAEQGTGEIQWVHVPNNPAFHADVEDTTPWATENSSVSAAEFSGAVSVRRIFCMSPSTGNLQCLDSATGKVVWNTAGNVFLDYCQTVSRDRMVIQLSTDRLVLSGEHHLRALDPATGEQLWVIEFPDLSVPPSCHEDLCFVLTSRSQFLAIDLRTGKSVGWSQAASAGENVAAAALSMHSNFVYQTNGTQVKAFRRADRVADSTADVRIKAAALMLDGHLDRVRRLRTMTDPSDMQLVQFLDDLTAAALLDELGWQENSASGPRITADDQAIVQELLALNLSDDLRARCYLLGRVLENPGLIACGRQRRLTISASPLIPVSRTWSLSERCLPETEAMHAWLEAADLPTDRLLALASFASRYPELLTRVEVQHLCATLRSRGMSSAEEIVWSGRHNWLLRTGDETSEIREQLNRIRGIVPRQEFSDEDQLFRDQSSLQAAVRYSFSSFRNSNAGDIDGGIFVQSPSEQPPWTELTNASPLSQYQMRLPAWYGNRLILRTDLGGVHTQGFCDGAGISSIGGEADWIDRTQSGFAAARNRYYSLMVTQGQIADVPGLLPLADLQSLSMVRLGADGELRTLWERSLSESSSMSAGPLTSSGLVWYYDRQLHCTDLLSGRDLWCRDVAFPGPGGLTDGGADFPHLWGDEQVTVTLWSGTKAWSAWDTRTGELLRSGTIPLGFSTTPFVIGRFFVFTDPEYRLHVLDPLDGRDVLATSAPVRIGVYQQHSIAVVTDSGMIMAVSNEGQLVTIDPRSGGIVNRVQIPLPPDEPCVALYLIPRDNEHLLLLRTAADRRQQRSYMSGEETPEMTGLLVVVDKATSEIRWSRPIQNAVLPLLAGDACDAVVLFSRHETGTPESSTGAPEPPVRLMSETQNVWFGNLPISVMVLNARNGEELLAEPVVLMSSQYRGEPLVFDAEKQHLILRTGAAELVIRPQQEQ